MSEMKADELLKQVKETGVKHDGQQVSPEHLQAQVERATQASQLEAAAFAEEIIKWLNDEFIARGFDVNQRVFSVALATINLRENLPADKGGKAAFDSIAYSARVYFDENK